MSAGAAREVRELIAALGLVRKVDLLAVVKKVGQWTRSTQAQQQQQQRQQAGKNAALYSLLIESVAVHRLVLRLVQTPNPGVASPTTPAPSAIAFSIPASPTPTTITHLSSYALGSSS